MTDNQNSSELNFENCKRANCKGRPENGKTPLPENCEHRLKCSVPKITQPKQK